MNALRSCPAPVLSFIRLLTISLLLSLVVTVPPRLFAQGALTNGWLHTGTVFPSGDSDSWTFSANIGDRIVVRVGEITQTGSFTPRIRLQNPSAVLIAASSGGVAAEVAVAATNTGTFTVIVDDLVGTSATGTYRLTLMRAPGAVSVAPGDEGGALTVGVMHTGTIDVGDLDVWTFSATTGDGIRVRMGDTNATSLTPALWIYGPDGVLVTSDTSGAAATEVSLRATNSGTFIVVAGDFSGGYAGSGPYRLTLAKTGDPVVVSSGDQGGPLTNGIMHLGNIDVGDLDVWTVSANTGDSIHVRVGDTNVTSLAPALWIYGPNGALLDSESAGAAASQVSVRATNSGTFLVIVGDFSGGYAGSGPYRLTLAKTGSAVSVSPGDQGGPMSNGIMHLGNIDVGDLDVWTVSAAAGDGIRVRMGDTNATSLTPALWIYDPSGALLDSEAAGAAASEVSVRATNSGTFLVVVGDFSAGYAGSGPYRLTLAKTGSAVAVSPGDQGGAMANGAMHTGTIDVGDLDVWTVSANTGDSIQIRMGDTNATTLTPALYIYGPSGALLASDTSGAVATELLVRATNSGTFLVVAADFSAGYAGSGPYRLTLAKTGDAVVVSPGDEGGPLTNGFMHLGTIEAGDLDVWTVSGSTGDSIVVRMGDTNATSLTPAVWIYGPSGALLGSDTSGAVATEVIVRATNSGVFIIVAGDYSGGYAGVGPYRLTLAKTGDAMVIGPGDEGGALNGVLTYDGNLPAGDLDTYYFTACIGDALSLRMDELVGGSTLTPWLRLYGRDGQLLRSISGAATAQFGLQATNSGTFLIVAGDVSGGYAGTGTYRITVNGLSAGLKLCLPTRTGTNVHVGGIGGKAGTNFVLFTQTNLTGSVATWLPWRTNQFDGFGVFNLTNVSTLATPQRFFILQTQ